MIRLFIALLGVYLAAMGCTDDNEQGSTETSQEVNDSITAAWLAKYCYIEKFLFTEQVDTHGDTIRVSAYGEVLSPITPTVYSLAVEDEDEAHRFFKEKCIPPAMDSIWKPDYDAVTVDLGEMGTITYQPNSNSGVIASIVVDIPSLPELSRIDFIQKDAWPTNSTSIFKIGEILMENKTKELFMVVQECEGGHIGLMMNDGSLFPDEELEDYSEYLKIFDEETLVGFRIRSGIAIGADEDAWQGLLTLSENVEGKETTMRKYFQNVNEEIVQYARSHRMTFPNDAKLNIEKLKERLYNDDYKKGVIAICGKSWSNRSWYKVIFLDRFVDVNGLKKYEAKNETPANIYDEYNYYHLGLRYHVKQAGGRSRRFTNNDESKYTRIFKYSF